MNYDMSSVVSKCLFCHHTPFEKDNTFQMNFYYVFEIRIYNCMEQPKLIGLLHVHKVDDVKHHCMNRK